MRERVGSARMGGVMGGAEWIRGRVGVRVLGIRVDRIDLMDGMDWMVSGVGATRRVGLRCGAAGPSGKQAADAGEGSGKKGVRSEKLEGLVGRERVGRGRA